LILLSAGGAILVGGCSSSSSTAATAPNSPSPKMSATSSASAAAVPCKQINSLRTSLTSLTATKISAGSAGRITSDLKNISTDLAALKGQAGGAFASQFSDLNTSVTRIKASAAQLSMNPTKAVKNLATELTTLKAKAQPMVTEMKAACPS
jgi:hypothetical protein